MGIPNAVPPEKRASYVKDFSLDRIPLDGSENTSGTMITKRDPAETLERRTTPNRYELWFQDAVCLNAGIDEEYCPSDETSEEDEEFIRIVMFT